MFVILCCPRKIDMKLTTLDENHSHYSSSLNETRQRINEMGTEMNNVQAQVIQQSTNSSGFEFEFLNIGF